LGQHRRADRIDGGTPPRRRCAPHDRHRTAATLAFIYVTAPLDMIAFGVVIPALVRAAPFVAVTAVRDERGDIR
jgi:hypothetical protein